MKVFKEVSIDELRDNDEFWGNAKGFADKLTDDECSELESVLEDIYPDGIDMTQLNDILAFDQDWVNESIGRTGDDDE